MAANKFTSLFSSDANKKNMKPSRPTVSGSASQTSAKPQASSLDTSRPVTKSESVSNVSKDINDFINSQKKNSAAPRQQSHGFTHGFTSAFRSGFNRAQQSRSNNYSYRQYNNSYRQQPRNNYHQPQGNFTNALNDNYNQSRPQYNNGYRQPQHNNYNNGYQGSYRRPQRQYGNYQPRQNNYNRPQHQYGNYQPQQNNYNNGYQSNYRHPQRQYGNYQPRQNNYRQQPQRGYGNQQSTSNSFANALKGNYNNQQPQQGHKNTRIHHLYTPYMALGISRKGTPYALINAIERGDVRHPSKRAGLSIYSDQYVDSRGISRVSHTSPISTKLAHAIYERGTGTKVPAFNSQTISNLLNNPQVANSKNPNQFRMNRPLAFDASIMHNNRHNTYQIRYVAHNTPQPLNLNVQRGVERQARSQKQYQNQNKRQFNNYRQNNNQYGRNPYRQNQQYRNRNYGGPQFN